MREAEIVHPRDTMALSTENKRTSCGVDSTTLATSLATVMRIFSPDREDVIPLEVDECIHVLSSFFVSRSNRIDLHEAAGLGACVYVC